MPTQNPTQPQKSAKSASPGQQASPRGELSIRTVAMPADTNPGGSIFGGWLLAQMDTAGGICAVKRAGGRVATVALKEMAFHKPTHVGDTVACYTDVTHVGRTSLTIRVEVWVERCHAGHIDTFMVTHGDFVFVALDEQGNKRPIPALGDD